MNIRNKIILLGGVGILLGALNHFAVLPPHLAYRGMTFTFGVLSLAIFSREISGAPTRE